MSAAFDTGQGSLPVDGWVSAVRRALRHVTLFRKDDLMPLEAFQDSYPDDLSHCYGCGRLNPHGLQIKSYWEGDEAVCRYTPQPYHTAIPGYVYGGLIASLIDCHSTGTASAAARRAEVADGGGKPPARFLTASLQVSYLKPTPIHETLEVRARIKEIKGRKVVIASRLMAAGKVCATGEVVAVQVPEHLMPR
jgi:acyl-coenzyme A thioesterase PaaI-like protein